MVQIYKLYTKSKHILAKELLFDVALKKKDVANKPCFYNSP